MRAQLTLANETSFSNKPKLRLSIASSAQEVLEVQRLRYQLFIEDQGLSDLYNDERLDKDEFDKFCSHLIVRDSETLKIVGTYRVLGPSAARQLGRFYSEQEFVLDRLELIRGRIAEAGRACIHPDYRGGAVLMLLWSGLAAFMKNERCDYLIGCASVSLSDGGKNAAALYQSMKKANLAPSEYRVTPRLPFPVGSVAEECAPHMPSLIKGYLKSGAWVCGAPAWDPAFHCADFFLMLPLSRLENRYARHYLKSEEALAA